MSHVHVHRGTGEAPRVLESRVAWPTARCPGRVVSWRARRRVAPAGTTSRCACHVPAHSAFAPPFISVVVGQAPPRSTARVWRGKRHTSQPDRTMHMPMQHTNCLALIGVSEVIMLRGHPPSFRNMTEGGWSASNNLAGSRAEIWLPELHRLLSTRAPKGGREAVPASVAPARASSGFAGSKGVGLREVTAP